jgi:hypothetical protein
MIPIGQDSQSIAVDNGGNLGHAGSERAKEADAGDISDSQLGTGMHRDIEQVIVEEKKQNGDAL